MCVNYKCQDHVSACHEVINLNKIYYIYTNCRRNTVDKWYGSDTMEEELSSLPLLPFFHTDMLEMKKTQRPVKCKFNLSQANSGLYLLIKVSEIKTSYSVEEIIYVLDNFNWSDSLSDFFFRYHKETRV